MFNVEYSILKKESLMGYSQIGYKREIILRRELIKLVNGPLSLHAGGVGWVEIKRKTWEGIKTRGKRHSMRANFARGLWLRTAPDEKQG